MGAAPSSIWAVPSVITRWKASMHAGMRLVCVITHFRLGDATSAPLGVGAARFCSPREPAVGRSGREAVTQRARVCQDADEHRPRPVSTAYSTYRRGRSTDGPPAPPFDHYRLPVYRYQVYRYQVYKLHDAAQQVNLNARRRTRRRTTVCGEPCPHVASGPATVRRRTRELRAAPHLRRRLVVVPPATRTSTTPRIGSH